jgi:DNA (cytosine-5)-methyltransferase 1
MKHGSLFSGIGGFDLASEWMGWENVFHCEWNPFGQKVLNYYWPNAITYYDITKTDFTIHRGRIDIITGGFPCQPYSSAGKRLGKEDERHLWPEMLRAIREIQPTWIVGENVRGLTNWNGGLVFDEVQSDLETQGYEVTPFLLPAASVNAPHRRDRIWFIAYNASYSNLLRFDKCIQYDEVNTGEGRIDAFGDINKGDVNGYASDSESEGSQGLHKARNKDKQHGKDSKVWRNIAGHNKENNRGNSINEDATDSTVKRLEGCARESIQGGGIRFAKQGNDGNASDSNGFGLRGQGDRIGNSRFINKKSKGNNWQNFPTVSPICDGNDGISDRLDSITFSKWRNESIKAGGNAVVPQVVYQIFKAIEKYNELDKQLTI